MRNKHIETVTETKEKEVLDSITCNKCGEEFIPVTAGWSNKNTNKILEFHHFCRSGGYYSEIGDDTYWEFDICDNCMIEFMTTLKLVPIFREESYFDDEDYSCQKFHEDWLQKKREELEKIKWR